MRRRTTGQIIRVEENIGVGKKKKTNSQNQPAKKCTNIL